MHGRADGRADGRACLRPGGRAAGPILNDSTTIFIDFHKKHPKTLCFFCRFASGGSASTDFYSSNEKGVQKTTKNSWFFDFSNHAGAQVPIFTRKMNDFEHATGSSGSSGSAPRSVVRNPGTLAPKVRITVVLNKLPQIKHPINSH